MLLCLRNDCLRNELSKLPLERQTMSTTTESTRIESGAAVVAGKVKLELSIEAVKAGE